MPRRPSPSDQLADAVDSVLRAPHMPFDLGVALLQAFERYDVVTGYRNRAQCRQRRQRIRQIVAAA